MKNTRSQIDAIVLAAGNSSRFGSDKRLHEIDGKPMLQRALAAVVDAVHSVTVVMKTTDRDGLPQLLGDFFTDARVKPLLLNHPESGMGSNLASAMKELSEEADGVLVMLADMPYVQSKTVQVVVDAFSPDEIIVPVSVDSDSQKRSGHPVLFSRKFFSELELLTGDNGARSVLNRYIEAVIFLSVADCGILQDIDVPAA